MAGDGESAFVHLNLLEYFRMPTLGFFIQPVLTGLLHVGNLDEAIKIGEAETPPHLHSQFVRSCAKRKQHANRSELKHR